MLLPTSLITFLGGGDSGGGGGGGHMNYSCIQRPPSHLSTGPKEDKQKQILPQAHVLCVQTSICIKMNTHLCVDKHTHTHTHTHTLTHTQKHSHSHVKKTDTAQFHMEHLTLCTVAARLASVFTQSTSTFRLYV